jgi:signal transduction histidine kinase
MLKYSFYDRVSNSLFVISNQIKDDIPSKNSTKIVTIPQKLDYPIYPVMISVVASDSMKVLAKTNITLLDIDLKKYLKLSKNFFIVQSENYGKIAIYISKIVSPIKGYIIAATPILRIDLKLQDIFIKMIILNPVLLIVILLGANVILDRILNPIKTLTKVANEISVGDLNRTIPIPKQDDEIKELVKAFNSMVIRLRNGIDMMERFNSDVSHELKTPLTVLKGEVEIALRKDRGVDYYKTTLNTMLKEIDYLIDMVEEMLFFTKLENEFETTTIQVDELLLDVMSKLSKKAKNSGVKLHIKYLDCCELQTNPMFIKTIFTNIIDNAIKYTPTNKNVYIYLKCDKEIVFEVKDEGIGIKREDIDKLTDRFYRTELSRNRNIKGFGLGLSIVAKTLEIIGGKIEFESSLNKGTLVRIKIKL